MNITLQGRDMRTTTNGMDAVNGGTSEEKPSAAGLTVAAAPRSSFVKAAGVAARSAIQINMGELLAPLSQLGGEVKRTNASDLVAYL